MLEEKIPEKVSELKKVYARIEALLLRENQNKSKGEHFIGQIDSLGYKINSHFYEGALFETN